MGNCTQIEVVVLLLVALPVTLSSGDNSKKMRCSSSINSIIITNIIINNGLNGIYGIHSIYGIYMVCTIDMVCHCHYYHYICTWI